MPRFSVVIPTCNRARFLQHSLQTALEQSFDDYEVVVSNNASTDATLEIIKEYDCKLVTITDADFSFGRSLNWGIEAASNEFIAITSGHCIPADDQWLAGLRAGFAADRIVGTYGRQEPLPDTSAYDKRDLWTTFGTEGRVQERDFFFHNANSMIRKRTWHEMPFDEEISGVEDRDWARRVQARGYQVAYQPTASVFHWHGIHHGRNEERSARVARVIEWIGSREN